MATQFDLGIDWDRDNFICWGAKPGDALNEVPNPVSLTGPDDRAPPASLSSQSSSLATHPSSLFFPAIPRDGAIIQP